MVRPGQDQVDVARTQHGPVHRVDTLDARVGKVVALSTDNRLMSGITLVEEYQKAARHLGFSFEELCVVARNGFTSAFLHEQERRALLATVDRDIAALLEEVSK